MEREHPLEPPDDAAIAALFARIDAPAPNADFVARTMQAVRRAPLPEGRKRLRSPLVSMFAWAALVAGVMLSALAALLIHPMFAASVTRVVGFGVGSSVWLAQFARAAFAIIDIFGTTGLAVARAAATREGTAGLLLMAAVCAVSLSALQRLLTSEGEESQWQEVS
jgi:hypothetical protein